jgi:peptidyl-prolyl cis-trans isomerase C
MKKLFRFSTAAILGMSLLFAGSAAAFGGGAAADKGNAVKDIDSTAPVAVVNGTPITMGEFQSALDAYFANLSRTMGGGKHSAGAVQPNDEIKSEILNQLIGRELLYGEIEKLELKGVDEKADKEFEAAKAGFPSDEEYKKELAAQNFSEAGLKKVIRRRFVLEAYVADVLMPTMTISDEEAQKFYDDNGELFESPEVVSASHILVKVAADADEATKAAAMTKIKDIRAKVVAGGDFAALATEFSEGPSNKNGGDLGFFAKGQMVKPFEEVAFALKVDEVSEVVETEFGYHLIKVAEKKETSKTPIAEMKDRIVQHLKNIKVNDALKGKIEELKATAKVDVVIPHM